MCTQEHLGRMGMNARHIGSIEPASDQFLGQSWQLRLGVKTYNKKLNPKPGQLKLFEKRGVVTKSPKSSLVGETLFLCLLISAARVANTCLSADLSARQKWKLPLF